MKALVERPKPSLQAADDAIVKIIKTTICGTDLHILKGDVPTCAPGRILGHEGVGVVSEAGAGVTMIRLAVLAERRMLHAFVARLKWSELRAALLLLAMTFVLLPLLPDRAVDPWHALNPRQLWFMMVVIAALSYVGYICIRVAGDRADLIFAAGDANAN